MNKIFFIILLGFSLNLNAGLFDKKDWYWKEDFEVYITKNRPLAESGEIKFSDYYKGMIAKLESFDIDKNKLFEVHVRKYFLNSYNAIMPYALKFESNQISRAEFDIARAQSNADQLKEMDRLAKVEKECKWEATSRAGNYTAIDGDITSHNPNKSLAASIVSGIELGSRQNNLMRLCVDAKL